MITTPFYIEKRKSDGSWLVVNRQDTVLGICADEKAAGFQRDMLNAAFQDGFAYCIDLAAAEAKALQAKHIERAHEQAKQGVAETAMAAGSDQPLVISGPGGDFQRNYLPSPESLISKAIAKVKYVFESIKESGNA